MSGKLHVDGLRLMDEKDREIATNGFTEFSGEQDNINFDRLALCWNQHDELVAQRDELVKMLKPFAAINVKHLDGKPDAWILAQWMEVKITLGNVRDASTVLAKIQKERE